MWSALGGKCFIKIGFKDVKAFVELTVFNMWFTLSILIVFIWEFPFKPNLLLVKVAYPSYTF